MADVQQEAFERVKEIQDFDANALERRQDLGERFAFLEAVAPAKRLIGLFAQIPVEQVRSLPDEQARQILDQANAILSRFREIMDFDPVAIENPAVQRDSLSRQLENSYPSTFGTLFNLISYLTSRERDFGAMEVQVRSIMETAQRNAQDLAQSLETYKESAEKVLADIRKVAAEQGVSQQAIHFKNESDAHETEAETWKSWTIGAVLIVVAYGIITIFLHKIPLLAPHNTYDAAQLAVSKLIVFAILAYGLNLCAKNYLAHKHNAVVNKHRQNALATYNTIADAAGDTASRDIVLSHAAECIFSPQDTGYNGKGPSTSEASPTLQVLPRIGGGGSGVG